MILVTGTSAAGKTTVVRALERQGVAGLQLGRPVTATDRAPRDGERDGVDYHFMTTDAFVRMANPDLSVVRFMKILGSGHAKREIMAEIGTAGFYECALVYGQLKGVPRHSLNTVRGRGEVPILVLDLQGVRLVRDVEGPERVVTVALVPPSLEIAESRIRSRDPGIDEEEVQRRLTVAAREIAEIMASDELDHVVVSEEGRTAETVARVDRLIGETLRRRNRARGAPRPTA